MRNESTNLVRAGRGIASCVVLLLCALASATLAEAFTTSRASIGTAHEHRARPGHREADVRRAAAGPGYGVSIQAVFTATGDPSVLANFDPDGALASPTFTICTPNGACTAGVTQKDGLVEPGPEPSGTTFTADATYHGQTYGSSVTWQGEVTALSAPTLTGQPRIGHVLVPVAADWSGGWAKAATSDEFSHGNSDQLGVQACRSARGRDCVMLGGGELGCPDSSSKTHLLGWYTGWYLFALDAREPGDSVCAGTGYSSNAGLPLWPLGQTVIRSGPLGRITGPPRPTVHVPARAVVSGRTLKIATIDCRSVCDVSMWVMDKTRGLSRNARFTGSRTLTIPRHALPAGRATVRLQIEDSASIPYPTTLP